MFEKGRTRAASAPVLRAMVASLSVAAFLSPIGDAGLAGQDSLVVAMGHRQLWRGETFGRGLTAEFTLDAGLLGHARSTLGWAGFRIQGTALAPISDYAGARRAAEQFGIGARGYACLNGSACEWALTLGVDEFWRPEHPGSDDTTTEFSVGVRGLKIFQRQGVTLVPRMTWRRDVEAYDAWMSELALVNLLGRGPTKLTLGALLRLSDFRHWGVPADDFGAHSGELSIGLRQAKVLGGGVLVSWAWLIDAGFSFADADVGDDVGFVRVGVNLIR